MKHIIIFIISLAPALSFACEVFNSSGQLAVPKSDGLYLMISNVRCPQDVISLKQIIKSSGLQAKPSMVANRGIHNPQFGSFSFFEEVIGDLRGVEISKGEFFFGHFTAAQNGEIVLDQAPRPGKLLVELIAWDYAKAMFNFYELIGTSNGGQWFYRGDSVDALLDNKNFQRDVPFGEQKFGQRMRCSACHNSGGPIMKEIKGPHNDWMTAFRPLSFEPNALNKEVISILSDINDASRLAQAVGVGRYKLEASLSYQQVKFNRSLQEQLRPIFCTEEINLESDSLPLQSPKQHIIVPSASFVSPFLATANINIDKADYYELLNKYGLVFPESGGIDADHAWLAPVKSNSDILSIQSLVALGIVSEEFVSDVLAVDFRNPTISHGRCKLLKLIPENSRHWEQQFANNLKIFGSAEALILLGHLTNPEMNKNYHYQVAQNYLNKITAGTNTSEIIEGMFLQLLNNRNQIFMSEISQNPMGQILEPGFRVVFPQPTNN